MKVFALSDLHLSITVEKPMDIFGGNWENYMEKIKANWQKMITDEDLVLIAGDLSWAMRIEEFEQDLDFFKTLPGKKIFIKGNHDYWWKSISAVRKILPPDMFALQYDAIRFNGIVICGTRGWDLPNSESSEHDLKIYNNEVLRLEMALKDAKSKLKDGDKLILMLHYPPFSKNYKNNELMKLINSYNVDIVVYGHIHNQFVNHIFEEIDGCRFYLTSCNLLENTPIQITI